MVLQCVLHLLVHRGLLLEHQARLWCGQGERVVYVDRHPVGTVAHLRMSLVAPLIGVTGRARAGKDTLAQILGYYGYARVALADPLRRVIASLTGMTFEELVNSPDKELPHPKLGGVSPRRAMQTLGTEWGRDLIWQDLWVTHAMDQIAHHPRVVIPDVRFDNEADAIRSRGGIILHVHRDAGETKVEAHKSEDGVTPHATDLHIYNNGSVSQLERQVAFWMAGVRR